MSLFVVYTIKMVVLGTWYTDVAALGLFLAAVSFSRHIEYKRYVKEQKDITSVQNQLNTLNNIIANSNISKIVKRDEPKVRKF